MAEPVSGLSRPALTSCVAAFRASRECVVPARTGYSPAIEWMTGIRDVAGTTHWLSALWAPMGVSGSIEDVDQRGLQQIETPIPGIGVCSLRCPFVDQAV